MRKESIQRQVIEKEQTNNGTKTVTFTTPTTTTKKTVSVNEQHARKLQSSITKYLVQQNNDTLNDEYLRPPKVKKNTQTIQTIQNENEIKAIYVSKFEYGTTKEAIKNHILRETTITDKDAFEVEKLHSKSVGQPDYVAFKISTVNEEYYDEIMNIWSPKFFARKYEAQTYRNEQCFF